MFSENDINPFLPYIFIVIGFGIMIYGFFKKTTTHILIKTGIKAEGIIYELKGKSSGTSTFFNNIVYDKIIVRFVTNKLEWVTAEAQNESGLFYSGQYKIGERVEVMYDPDDPNRFIIITKQSENNARLFAIVTGLIFIIAGLFKLFK